MFINSADRALLPWLLLGIVIAYAVPADGFNVGVVASVLDFVSSHIPVIGNVAQKSGTPKLIEHALGTMWLLAPLELYFLIQVRDVLFPIRKWRGKNVALLISAYVMAGLFFATSVFLLGRNHFALSGFSTRGGIIQPMLGSRMGLGFFGSLLILATCYTCTAAITFTLRSIKGEEE